MNKLYLLVTPIGNINDLSFSTLKKLQELDYIYCEDTRVTLKIIRKFKIKTKNKLLILNDTNEIYKTNEIIKKIQNGNTIGLICDAGYPVINDPGYKVIEACYKKNISVEIIGGTSAILSALILSNLKVTPFIFEGFLTFNKQSKTIKKLKQAFNIEKTSIFFLAKHDLKKFDAMVMENFLNYEYVIIKEISKINQKIYWVVNKSLFSIIPKEELKGEFVLVIGPNKNISVKRQETTLDIIRLILNKQLKPKEKAKKIAYISNLKTSDIYNLLIKLTK